MLWNPYGGEESLGAGFSLTPCTQSTPYAGPATSMLHGLGGSWSERAADWWKSQARGQMATRRVECIGYMRGGIRPEE
jgi:hypothetical protein